MADSPIFSTKAEVPAIPVEAPAAEKGEHLKDFVFMKAPGRDGEIKRVSTKGDAIAKKMFAGFRQVDENGKEI